MDNLIFHKAFPLWDRIINAGAEPDYWSQSRKKIRLTNIMSIALVCMSFPIDCYFYYLGFRKAGVGVMLADLLFLVAIYLNHKKKIITAKLLILAIVNFVALPYVLLFGLKSGIHYVYLPFSCLPFILFELKDWKYILTSLTISILLFLNSFSNFLQIPIAPVDIEMQQHIFIPIMILVFSIILSNIYYLSSESELAEDLILKAKADFEVEILEARKVLASENISDVKNSIAEVLSAQLSDLKKSEEELKSSNEQLKRINNDLDSFIYSASHDLKSPISNIEGLINVLVSHNHYKNEEVKEIIDMMSLSVSKFKNTINDLIEVSKIEQEAVEINKEIDFMELVEEVKFSISELIKVSHARIYCDFQQAEKIRFSRRNLRSILYNLISNAIKYKAYDRIPEVSVRTVKMENEMILLQVEDNGLGISEENIPKIFSMFKRVHDHVDGSGVGLYIVKKIVENNNGHITVESKVGSGSKFSLFLSTRSN